MHKQTAAAWLEMRRQITWYDRLMSLKNAYRSLAGTCFVISCGPSTSEVLANKEFRRALKSKLLVCIKGAIDYYPRHCDFHIYNSDYSIDGRRYEHPYTTRITVHKDAYKMGSDIHFPLHPEQGASEGKTGLSATISAQHNWADWEISKSYKRPWGPGVMSEIGIFLPVHLGVKRIVVIGWDLNPNELRHYYDDSVKNLEKYKREGKLISGSIPSLLAWLETIGVELVLCSPRSALPIPQVRMEDIL
jgi:hypothetical protein